MTTTFTTTNATSGTAPPIRVPHVPRMRAFPIPDELEQPIEGPPVSRTRGKKGLDLTPKERTLPPAVRYTPPATELADVRAAIENATYDVTIRRKGGRIAATVIRGNGESLDAAMTLLASKPNVQISSFREQLCIRYGAPTLSLNSRL